MENYMFREGLTVQGRISFENYEYVSISNIKPVGVCGRGVILAGEYNGKTYYDTVTSIMVTFLFPENNDSFKDIIENRLWKTEPSICL